MDTISVLVADSDYLIREGLKHIFAQRPNIEVKEEATSQSELLRKLYKDDYDVVILDYNQPKHFDMSTLEEVRKAAPKTNILVISSDTNKRNIYDVIAGGVNNFLTKRCSKEEIFAAVRAAAKGEKFFCKTILNYILEKSLRSKKEETVMPLTARELEIVRLVAQGLISKQIASKLDITIHTVYTHRKKILKKLGLSSASELVLYAVNQGIVN
ncbi:MAG: response regulator transcription factor [Bacteroidota bacterium]